VAPILHLAGDLDGALREALVSLEELRGQDEPFWTAVAAARDRGGGGGGVATARDRRGPSPAAPHHPRTAVEP
jgi:hypothetical protein